MVMIRRMRISQQPYICEQFKTFHHIPVGFVRVLSYTTRDLTCPACHVIPHFLIHKFPFALTFYVHITCVCI